MKKSKFIEVETQPPQITKLARRKFLPAVLCVIKQDHCERKLETTQGGKWLSSYIGTKLGCWARWYLKGNTTPIFETKIEFKKEKALL